MSLYTLQNKDCETIQKFTDFNLSCDKGKASSLGNVLSSMARGCLIECCEPETIDNNPKKNGLEQIAGASEPVLESMKSELNRLKSYTNRWPSSFIEPSDLAAVGLFYLGMNDNVQCAFCHGIISDWELGDNPLEEHARHFPFCPFLLNSEVGNVPISGKNGRQKWQVQSSHSECGRCTESAPELQSSTVQSFRPKHPAMGSFDRRLETFRNWPSSAPLTAIQLAEAGLFYSGVADVTTCFSCGGSMGNWCREDQAWVEHAKHFPDCEYVKCIKGSRFTQSVRQPSGSADNFSNETAKNMEETVKFQMSETVSTSKPAASSSLLPASTGSEASPALTGQGKFMCKICMEEGSRVVFVPCGHSLACPKCAANLTVCPMCRKHIDTSVKLFFDD